MHAQAANPEVFEQAPMPVMERPAPNPNFGQAAVANVTHFLPEGYAAERNPQPVVTVSIGQPQDETSPGLRRAVDKAVYKAFGRDTNPQATASDQTQECVDAALNGLHIKKGPYTTMIYPGDRRKQITGTEARVNPVSPACLPLINREVPKVFFKMQSPNNPKRWIRTKTQELVDDQNDFKPVGNEGGIGGAYVTPTGKGGAKAAHFLYRCTPGEGITHALAVYSLKVDSAIDGHTLGHRTESVPVDILRVSGPVMGGGVRGEC